MAIAPPRSSAEQSGLIYGYLFRAGQAPLALDTVHLQDWLQRSASDAGLMQEQATREFAWLHFSLSNANTLRWLHTNLQLPEQFYDTLQQGTGSTRIEQAEDALVAIVNDVSYEFSYESSQIATLFMCVQARLLVSARVHPLRSIERLRDAVRGGEDLDSPVALLAHLLRDQADVLTQIARDATNRVDKIEDHLLAGRLGSKRASLGALRRVFVRLRRLLALEPGALFRLLNRPPSWFVPAHSQDLRDATEEFSVVLGDISSLQERMKLLQEEIAAQTTEQTNRGVFILTIFTVLALPINMIAGLFGMNVGGIPLAENTHGFWIVAGIVVSFTSAIGCFAWYRQRHEDS